MTSLRTFQTEIEEIHHRELLKQRTQAPADSIKDIKHPAQSSKGKAKDDGHANGAADVDADTSPRSSMLELEEKFLALLQSNVPADNDTARDMIAALLTQHRGEYVLRIGMQPSHAHLFTGELSDASDSWTGVPRTEQDLDLLRERVMKTVEEVGGKTSVLFETRTGHPRISLLLRLPPPNVSLTPEVRCAVVGNVDSGKSTTLGVLTRGALDDGRGRARVGLFRHKHELETGRTSSVGMEILGFGPSGAPILPNAINSTDPDVIRREKLGWEEISIQAAKIVSFIDLAGHERYLKTTLYGLTSGAPSCVILIVGANAGLIGMSKEHLAIALALSVPVVVCITKIDMTPANKTAETIKQVVKILKSPGCRKTPVFVNDVETAVELSTSFGSDRLCPIFQISNVTGEGLDYVRTFLNLLPSSEADNEKFAVDQPLEFSVTEVWSVPYVGTVVNGIMNAGSVKTGDAVLLGPDSNGNYIPTVIKSMQRKRANVTTAEAGQCVSFALKRVRRAAVRKGMVLVPKTEAPPRSTRQFEGQVLILYHNTTLQKNYQAMLHCGAVRQTVRIVGMDHPQGVLRTGDRATVQFEFISHPEFVKEGMKLLFREGKTKGLGVITRLL
ncbi:GTP-binding protein 1 [Lyophyllum atratum]|nr:GTP-binding protein 1 [Lyophyllum atratum]